MDIHKSNQTRRDFLKTSALTVASSTLGGVPAAIPETAAPIVAAAMGKKTLVHGLLNRLGKQLVKFSNDDDLNNWHSIFDTYFGYEAKPRTADEFFAALTPQIEHLYASAAGYAEYLQKLAPHREEAGRILAEADKAVKTWGYVANAAQDRFFTNVTREWVHSPGTAHEKMDALRKYRSSNPFTGKIDLIDWDSPAETAIAALDQRLGEMQKRMEGKSPEEAASAIEESEENLLHNMLNFVYFLPGNNKKYTQHDDEVERGFAAVQNATHLGEEMLWNYHRGPIELPWFPGREETLPITIDTPPETIIRRIGEAVQNIPVWLGNCARDPRFHSNDALRDEVLTKLPGFVNHIIPQMLARHFPHFKHREGEPQEQPAKPDEEIALPKPEKPAARSSWQASFTHLGRHGDSLGENMRRVASADWSSRSK